MPVFEAKQDTPPARANGAATLKDLIDSPNFFPFRIKPIHAEGLVAASSNPAFFVTGLMMTWSC